MSISSAKPELTLAGHVKATFALGLPLVGAQLAQMAIGVTDTIMIGWLGAEPLAGAVLGFHIFFVIYIFGAGFAHAIVPIAASAFGRGDDTQLRRAVRMGFWVVALYTILGLVILAFAKPIYLALGQSEATTDITQTYIRIAMWGLPFSLATMVLRSFLTTLELARIILIASVLAVLLNILLNYMFIFGNWGAPRLEVEGAAWSSLGTSALLLAILVWYCLTNKTTAAYQIFARFWRSDWPAFFENLRLGLPISLGILAEVGLFSAATVMMGWIGTIPLAAHGVALNIISVAFMVPLGISNAATVRVGLAYGRDDWIAIRRAMWAVMLVGVGFALLAAIAFALLPKFFVSLFLDFDNVDAQSVLRAAIPLLLMAAAFQLVDSIQIVMVGVLRGLKDTKRPMQLGILGYWGFGVPTAYILAFPLGFGGIGIWAGLAIGLAVAALVMAMRFRYLVGTLSVGRETA